MPDFSGFSQVSPNNWVRSILVRQWSASSCSWGEKDIKHLQMFYPLVEILWMGQRNPAPPNGWFLDPLNNGMFTYVYHSFQLVIRISQPSIVFSWEFHGMPLGDHGNMIEHKKRSCHGDLVRISCFVFAFFPGFDVFLGWKKWFTLW